MCACYVFIYRVRLNRVNKGRGPRAKHISGAKRRELLCICSALHIKCDPPRANREWESTYRENGRNFWSSKTQTKTNITSASATTSQGLAFPCDGDSRRTLSWKQIDEDDRQRGRWKGPTDTGWKRRGGKKKEKKNSLKLRAKLLSFLLNSPPFNSSVTDFRRSDRLDALRESISRKRWE